VILAASTATNDVSLQAANQNTGRGGVAPEALLLLEQKVEARFTLLGSQFVTIEALRDWEMR
jgi:hypothetical protein